MTTPGVIKSAELAAFGVNNWVGISTILLLVSSKQTGQNGDMNVLCAAAEN